jgi:hypothetical protein
MAIVERARAEVESLPSDLVYVGFSSGVLAAQSLAQTRPGASGGRRTRCSRTFSRLKQRTDAKRRSCEPYTGCGREHTGGHRASRARIGSAR